VIQLTNGLELIGSRGHLWIARAVKHCSADVSERQRVIVCVVNNMVQPNVCYMSSNIFTSHVYDLRAQEQWGDNSVHDQA
jgi:hypothetical protein